MRRAAMAGLAVFCASAAFAQVPPPDIAPRTTDPALRAREEAVRAAFATMPDTPGTGPYAAIKESDPGLPHHTVYRPADLDALGARKLGIIVWGNGGCRDDGAAARQHLAEIASHGYVAIAPGEIKSGPGAPPQTGQAEGKTTTADVLAGLDWALAENERRDSPYHGRIDPRLTGVAGTSCGGLQAIQAAADPRIHAVIVHNSGIFSDDRNPETGAPVDKSLLTRFHTPVLYILGGKSDVAYPNGADDFRRLAHVPAMLASLDVGHGGTLREKNGGPVAQVAVDWFEWQLRGDQTAAQTFVGADCGLCKDSKWTIERKKIG